MTEPFEVLLSPLREVWWLEPLLSGERPNWGAIIANPYFDSLSRGERVLLDIAQAIDFANPTATVADLLYALDRRHRDRAIYALAVHCEMVDV